MKNTFLKIVKDYQLELELKYLINKNFSNFLPYHNLNHTLTMLENCYHVAIKEFRRKSIYYDEIRNILVAALFHDFEHSGGAWKDSENIDEALKSFDKFLDDNRFKLRWIPYNTDVVKSIISVTQYPFIHEPATLEQKIIRDCDLMQAFETDWLTQTLFGLMHEMGITDTVQAIDRQIEFLSNATLYTETGKLIFAEKLPKLIEDLNSLKNILKLE